MRHVAIASIGALLALGALGPAPARAQEIPVCVSSGARIAGLQKSAAPTNDRLASDIGVHNQAQATLDGFVGMSDAQLNAFLTENGVPANATPTPPPIPPSAPRAGSPSGGGGGSAAPSGSGQTDWAGWFTHAKVSLATQVRASRQSGQPLASRWPFMMDQLAAEIASLQQTIAGIDARIANVANTPPPSYCGTLPDGSYGALVSGAWSTSSGDMHLQEDGVSVSGTFNFKGGQIQGTLNGDVMTGIWVQQSSDHACAVPQMGSSYWGQIRWTFDRNRRVFTGTWGYCVDRLMNQSWTGHRTDG